MIDVSKRSPIAHTTFKSDFKKKFYMKARSTHLFKDVSFTEFPSHCIVMALPVCTLIIRLTRESVECVGVNRLIYED